MRELTKGELKILDLTRELVGRFAALPVSHPADMEEIVTFVHGIQNIVLARPATESLAQGEEDDAQVPELQQQAD